MPARATPYHQRVGLLGGSFNPPHAGHREISLAALERLKLDAVWWLVTPGNPLKDPDTYAPFEERLRLAQHLSNHSDIIVSDFESRHNLQYTVDTLNQLILEHPGIQFVWLMGADSLANFHRWKDWRKITELAPIAVFNRPDYRPDALNSQAAKSLLSSRIDEKTPEILMESKPPAWVFFSDIANPTSSTEIRNQPKQKKIVKT